MADKQAPWTAKKIHQILLLIEDKRATNSEKASIYGYLSASVREFLEDQYGLKAKVDAKASPQLQTVKANDE